MVTNGVILSGRYLIIKEIGVGGMGAVYEATDLRTGAQVAVKVLHPMYARNPQYISRLRREARIAASIRTPRAVRVIDLDDHEEMPFLVMEYVAGENLSDRLDRDGPLPVGEALGVCIDITRALEGAHAVGVVHRDLKPQNVKITDEGEVKVLDFGIARAENLPGITGTNMFTGTPEYCAPERIDGPGDIRSDIYSIGIMLYELVTGTRPFDAPTAFAMLRKHESAPVPPLPPGTPPVVQAIIDRTLAKRPEDRYQTPSDLLSALREARGMTPGATASATPAGRSTPSTAAGTPPPAPQPLTPIAPTLLDPGARTVTRAPGATGPTEQGDTGGGTRRTPLLIGAGALALVLIGAIAFAATRGSSGNGTPSPTARVVDVTTTPTGPTASATGGPSPSATAALRALLMPGEKVQLNAASELLIPRAICPSPESQPQVKSILRITSVERAASSRQVTVAYTVSIPRVPGVECPQLRYTPDSDSRLLSLQTVQQPGRVVAATSTGGTGVGVTGADDTYGRDYNGTWIFDDVELDGRELTLVQQERRLDGSAGGIFHTIRLLPR